MFSAGFLSTKLHCTSHLFSHEDNCISGVKLLILFTLQTGIVHACCSVFRGFLECNCFVLSKNRIIMYSINTVLFPSISYIGTVRNQSGHPVLCQNVLFGQAEPVMGMQGSSSIMIAQCDNKWWLQCCYCLSSHCYILCGHGRDEAASRKLSHPSSSFAVLCNIIFCGRLAIPSQ